MDRGSGIGSPSLSSGLEPGRRACLMFDSISNSEKYESAFSRRDAPELCMNLSPHRGRGECRVPAAPADGVTGPRGPSKQAALATAQFVARVARLAWKAGGRPSH
jgi:hypothetical protein